MKAKTNVRWCFNTIEDLLLRALLDVELGSSTREAEGPLKHFSIAEGRHPFHFQVQEQRPRFLLHRHPLPLQIKVPRTVLRYVAYDFQLLYVQLHGSRHKGGLYHVTDDFSNARENTVGNKKVWSDSASNGYSLRNLHSDWTCFERKSHCPRRLVFLSVRKEASLREDLLEWTLQVHDGHTWKPTNPSDHDHDGIQDNCIHLMTIQMIVQIRAELIEVCMEYNISCIFSPTSFVRRYNSNS